MGKRGKNLFPFSFLDFQTHTQIEFEFLFNFSKTTQHQNKSAAACNVTNMFLALWLILIWQKL
jgi:hypothetical protein